MKTQHRDRVQIALDRILLLRFDQARELGQRLKAERPGIALEIHAGLTEQKADEDED